MNKRNPLRPTKCGWQALAVCYLLSFCLCFGLDDSPMATALNALEITIWFYIGMMMAVLLR